MDTAELTRRLNDFVRNVYAPDATVSGLVRMPGHSGLTYGFDVHPSSWPGDRDTPGVDRLVIRLSPAGGPARGNTDMVRQALLLQAAGRARVPVPPVRWYGDDPCWFGGSFHMTTRMPGRPFQDWDPDPSFDRSADGVLRLYLQAVDVLAAVHRIPAHQLPIAAERSRAPHEEVLHWRRVAAKAGTGPWSVALEKAAERLLAEAPGEARQGLVHGDFRGGNLLFDSDRLVAVLDWEIAGLGSQHLDLAWLLLFLDAARWYGTGPRGADEVAARVVERYRELTGCTLADLPWYAALAGYRYAAIILFNHMLHVSGKRPDPLWGRMAGCVPALLAQTRQRTAIR